MGGKQAVAARVGRREAPASATVSQHPAAFLLPKAIGRGAERSGGGGRAAERTGGGTAMLLIYLAVGGDSFQSISALSIIYPSVHPCLSLPIFFSV